MQIKKYKCNVVDIAIDAKYVRLVPFGVIRLGSPSNFQIFELQELE